MREDDGWETYCESVGWVSVLSSGSSSMSSVSLGRQLASVVSSPKTDAR